MEVQAFSLLCALGTISCLASITARRELWFFVAGSLAGIMLINPAWFGLPFNALLAIDPAQISLLLFFLAIMRIRSMPVSLLMLSGGVLSQVWLQTLGSLGYPPAIALVLVLAAAMATMGGSLYSKKFCNPALLDEAFLIVMAYAFAMATVPEAISGWHSAVGLQATDGMDAGSFDGLSILWVVLAFAVLGGMYASWRRRKQLAVNNR